MSSRTFILNHSKARNRALEAVKQAPDGYAVKVGEPTRSLEANAAMWPILDAFAKQKQWPVNGKLEWISAEEYKDILSAAFEQETVRLAQGLDGGVVMLGKRTSKFSKKRFSEWLEFLHATAAQFGIDTKY
jgi:hypothetical protein